MKRIFTSLMVIGVASMVAVGATYAYFSDSVTSTGNTFGAQTLDLNVNGGNTNVQAFNVLNLRPGSQPKSTYTLNNVGTLNGFLDIEEIVVKGYENSCISPEVVAGDTTCGPQSTQGELDDVMNLRMFVDYGCDGWISAGDVTFFNGKFNTLPASFELDEALNAGATVCVTAIADWWSTPMDNLAQGDSIVMDMTFELGQTAAQ